MLDKSVPFAGLYMKRERGISLAQCALPEGYSFSYYQPGDEVHWARIETSVLEFDSEFAALMRFKQGFAHAADELPQRCMFIEAPSGEKVATATVWLEYINGECREWLHWVAVTPEYQHRGLGRALITEAVARGLERCGDIELYLHTQTWSHRAIRLYEMVGFRPTKEAALYRKPSDNYKKAMKILAKIYAE